MPQRKIALTKDASSEYIRVLDVCNKYSVHNSAIAFTCRRVGQPNDLHTPGQLTSMQVISRIYPESKACLGMCQYDNRNLLVLVWIAET